MSNSKDDDLNKKLDDALSEVLKEIEKSKNQKKASKNINKHSIYLNSVIGEFANPFILVGYDINGGYFQLVNCSSQKEHDSLCIALDRCKQLGFNANVDIDDLFSEND